MSQSPPANDNAWRTLAHILNTSEAHLLCGRLRAMGIDAKLTDEQLAQTHSLLAVAIGGARILVPAAAFDEAEKILADIAQGDYALDDNFDVGPPPSANDES